MSHALIDLCLPASGSPDSSSHYQMAVLSLIFFILLALALVSLPIGYIRLCLAMRRAAINRPPYIHFLLIFSGVGTLLVGIVFNDIPVLGLSEIVAPIVILVKSCFFYFHYEESGFHRAAFWCGLAYFGLPTLTCTLALFFAP